jgi:predicted lipoprotein
MVPSVRAARAASRIASSNAVFCLTVLLGVVSVVSITGCHVVTDQELAAIRAQGQHHGPDPAKVFTDQMIPYADKNAKPAAQVIGALNQNFDDACKQYGFRQSQAFPCNFWIRVQGKVTRVDTASRVGKAYVDVTPASGGDAVHVALETGPVVIGTGVRDGFPGVKYSDFDDQTRFAAFGQAINKLVVERAQASLKLKVGDTVDVAAVYSSWSEPTGEIRAIPVAWK